jgi:phage-related protein
MQGLSGYASMEAANTISGSVGAMKAAWTNLLTGLADGNADIEKLVDDLVSTIAGDGTKNNLGVIGNILPTVEAALDGAGKLIDNLLPIVIEKIPAFIEKYLPKILQSGVNIIRSILNGISSNPNQIVNTIMSVVNILIDAIVDLLPEIIVTGSLLLGKLAVGIIQAIPELVAKIPQVIKSVVDGFKNNSSEFLQIGIDIVIGVWNGIKSMLSTFTRNVKNFFSSIVDSVKKTLGIHSPSRVFAEIGSFMAKGLDEGWEDEFGNVKKDIDNSLSFDDAHIGIGTSVGSVGSGMSYGGTSIGNITINIDGAKYSNEQSLAEAIAEAIQGMTDRRAAVYA